MQLFSLLVALSILHISDTVHGHGLAPRGEALEMYRRDTMHAYRSLEKRCGDHLRKRKAERLQQRALITEHASRDIAERASNSSSNSSACLLTPEVTQGPYHILDELVRQNISEGQAGIPMQVEIDLIDVETCKPVSAWIDAWHCNATGYYSGYVASTGKFLGGFPAPPAPSSLTSPTQGADIPGSGLPPITTPTDNESFLRGAWTTDDNGHVTMYSIFPGWYSGRAQHFHIKVYPEATVAKNGTFLPNGTAIHTGQFFYDNSTLEAVAATYPYNTNSIPWANATKNEQDQWYPYQNSLNYTADMDIEWVNPKNITYGVVGSITVGVNMSYHSPELATFDWGGNGTSTKSDAPSKAIIGTAVVSFFSFLLSFIIF